MNAAGCALTSPLRRQLVESPTHRRIVEAAYGRGWLQLHELQARVANISQTALSARLRELRRLGYTVDVRLEVGANGARLYFYRIGAVETRHEQGAAADVACGDAEAGLALVRAALGVES